MLVSNIKRCLYGWIGTKNTQTKKEKAQLKLSFQLRKFLCVCAFFPTQSWEAHFFEMTPRFSVCLDNVFLRSKASKAIDRICIVFIHCSLIAELRSWNQLLWAEKPLSDENSRICISFLSVVNANKTNYTNLVVLKSSSYQITFSKCMLQLELR